MPLYVHMRMLFQPNKRAVTEFELHPCVIRGLNHVVFCTATFSFRKVIYEDYYCWVNGVCCCVGSFYMNNFTETLFVLVVVDVLRREQGELAPCDGLFINQTMKAHMDNSSACVMSSVG